jgi:beta-glucosidase
MVALIAAPMALAGPRHQPPAGHGHHRLPVITGVPKVDRLIRQMTLEEKLRLIEGASEPAETNQFQAGYLPGIPRLGIPSLRLSDGPPGTATKLPSVGMTQTMGVAASFDPEVARENGVVIGRDARALGIDVTLQPFVNLLRDPTWGRAFNVFGEDPLLTGQTGAAEIEGIQSQGVMAQVKHFIAYDGSNNVVVDEQTLHETYLPPFVDAVDAGVASVMCSYNQINGPYACDNETTLTRILRGELGFKGFVTSDWGANHSLDSINAGVDMEMPGEAGASLGLPAFWNLAAMRAAVEDGTVPESTIDRAVGRILYEENRFGLLDGASKHEVTPQPVQADEEVVQRTGEKAAVLLKDEGAALPLDGQDLESLALVGPGAGQTMATGGGGERGAGLPSYAQFGTYGELQRLTGGNAHIAYAVGDDMTGEPVPASALSHEGQPGLLRTDAAGGATQVDPQLDFTHSNGGSLPAGSELSWTGTLTVPEEGEYWLNIQSLGASAGLTVDGKALGCTGPGVIGGCGSPRLGVVKATDIGPLPTTDGLANGRAQVELTAGEHTVSVQETPDASGAPVEVRLNWVTPRQQREDQEAAVAAASKARTAVVFAWSNGDLSKPLPEGQDRLIEEVAAVNPDTVVVLNNNLPVAMPWLEDVQAVVDMWFPGDAGGTATANILLGRANPGGRLPFTWPASLSQGVANQPEVHPERTSGGVDASGRPCPPSENPIAPPSGCTTTYSEGIFIGYRWYDQQHEEPLFPFGYGLSYTGFDYSGLRVKPSSHGGLDVSFQVRNRGYQGGDEVPQVYLGPPAQLPAGAQFAVRSLAGYERVYVPGGASRTITIHVPERSLEYWSTSSGWTVASGSRPVYVGASSRDIRLEGGVSVKGGHPSP